MSQKAATPPINTQQWLPATSIASQRIPSYGLAVVSGITNGTNGLELVVGTPTNKPGAPLAICSAAGIETSGTALVAVSGVVWVQFGGGGLIGAGYSIGPREGEHVAYAGEEGLRVIADSGGKALVTFEAESSGKVRLHAADPLDYLDAQMADSISGNVFDPAMHAAMAAAIVDMSGDDKLKIYLQPDIIAGFDSTKKQALIHTAAGQVQWMTIGECP